MSDLQGKDKRWNYPGHSDAESHTQRDAESHTQRDAESHSQRDAASHSQPFETPALPRPGAFRPTPESTDRTGFARLGFADQLSIDTPEQVALTFPVAGIGSRFVALLLDTLLQIGVVLVVALLFAAVSAALGTHRNAGSLAGKWFVAVMIFAGFLLFWGYFALFEALWRGQTPGKRALQLRVIKDSGRGITPFESLARNLLRVIDYLPSLYLAGVVTMLANKRNKRLGDLAAGTLVIHDRPEVQPLLHTGGNGTGNFFAPSKPWSVVAETANPFPADRIARLSAHDLVVMEAFFARALDLPVDVRTAMAHGIAAEMAGKMGVAPPEGNPERALEAMALSMRRQAARF